MKIQSFQNKVVRLISGAPRYVKRELLHLDLRLPIVDDVIQRYALRHESRLHRHTNPLVLNLLDNSTSRRRLKRRHPVDLASLNFPCVVYLTPSFFAYSRTSIRRT